MGVSPSSVWIQTGGSRRDEHLMLQTDGVAGCFLFPSVPSNETRSVPPPRSGTSRAPRAPCSHGEGLQVAGGQHRYPPRLPPTGPLISTQRGEQEEAGQEPGSRGGSHFPERCQGSGLRLCSGS